MGKVDTADADRVFGHAVMSDRGMCSDGETAVTGKTAVRIAANTAG